MEDARLELTGAARRRVRIDKVPFLLGRRAESNLVLPYAEVSRDHAEIVEDGAGYALRDRGSRYGTFLNDEPVTERTLADGDRIRLGRSGGAELVFRLAGATAPATARNAAEGFAAATDLRQVAVLLEGLRALSSARVLDDVLVLVMDSAIAVSGAERGFIMLANGDGALELKLARARGRRTLPGSGFETSRKIPEEVFRTGRTRIEADLLDGDLANVHVGTVALGIRHVLCVPLRLMRFSDAADAAPAGGEWQQRIGVLYLDSRDKAKLLSPGTEGALETLANEAAVAIQNAELYRAALENAKLERELQTAAEIQQALLPKRQRSGGFFEAAAATLPCRSIGGDFFDYIDRPDGALAFALGDVAGKGPPAALLAALMQGSLAAEGCVGAGPAATMTTVNTALVRRGVQGRFVTLFYAVLHPDGRLVYCNAGHNAPVLVTASGVSRLDTGGMVVGLFDGVPFEEGTAVLQPADYVVLFSDGVSEAMNGDEEEYGDDRLLECLADTTGSACEPRLQAILASVERFTASAPQHDDVTAMVVTYQPRASAPT
ncbi:MAG: SpoIIE family protein phosphatase [Acidobacteria bacterium]|nr:SpoIIE family protein phosphatase [Acidobacteriota bacterium]